MKTDPVNYSLLFIFLIVFNLSCGNQSDPRTSSEKTLNSGEKSTPVKVTLYVNVKPGLAFRKSPESKNNNKLSVIPFGSAVRALVKPGPQETLLGLKGNWRRVEYHFKTGWVFGPLLNAKNPLSYDAPAAYIVKNGRAILEPVIEEPSSEEISPKGSRLILYSDYLDGHDLTFTQYVLNQKSGKAKVHTCSFWSGPGPKEGERIYHCTTKVFKYRRRGDRLTIGNMTYNWDRRTRGFLPANGTDWNDVLSQVFEGKEPSTEDGQVWAVRSEVNCRFHDGSEYGGEQLPFLCEKEYDDYNENCSCFEKGNKKR